MEINKQSGFAKLSWNGTSTPLDILICDGRIVFKGESTTSQGDEYFIKCGDLATLEMIINILNAVDCGGQA